jgi:two-component system, LytTR family, sensor kinase
VVQLTVADDGPGLGSARPEDLMKGIGLSNTRSRLRQLYGAAHRFELRERGGGGLEVSIEIPFRNGSEDDRG